MDGISTGAGLIQFMAYTIMGSNAQPSGPIAEEEVIRRIAQGRLNPQSMAKTESDPAYRPLSAFPEFADAFAPQMMARETAAGRLRERVDTFCARTILLVVLFILVWGPMAFGGMSASSFLVIQALTVAALALWMVRFWVQRPFRLLWPPMCWAVLAFLLYAVARCRLVEVEYTGRQQLIHVLVYGALFFVTLNNLNRKNSASFASLTLMAVGFLLALFAVFQFATHYPLIWGVPKYDQYLPRGSGTFMNPNHLAGFLCLTMPLALAYTVMSRFSATIKVLLAYGTVVMLAGIVVSVSRGGILAAAIGLIVFCVVLVMYRDFWKPALVIMCILTVLAIGAASQFETVQKRFDKALVNDKVADERSLYWVAAWKLFERDVPWGIGPGHFDVEFPSVRPWQVQSRPQFAHNDYLNTLCEWGVAGMGLIGAACGLLLWGVLPAWQSLRKPSQEIGSRFSDRTAFIVGAAVGLLAAMLHCIVEFNMQIAALAVTAVTLMALLAAQVRFATERYWRNPGRLGKILLTAVAAAAIGYLSAQGLRKGTETYWLYRADTEPSSAERGIASATKAHEAEPMNPETDYLLGANLLRLSARNGPTDQELVKRAMPWFAKAMLLNRFDAYAPCRYGMCLDRLGQTQAATPYFALAVRNDPQNNEIDLQTGRHCIELGDYELAKEWLDKAVKFAMTPVAFKEWLMLHDFMSNPLNASLLKSPINWWESELVNNDKTATYSSWNLSTNGATAMVSALIYADGQSTFDNVHLGVINSPTNGFNSNQPVAFECFRLVPRAVNWPVYEEYRTNNTTVNSAPLGTVTVEVGHWYKFVVAVTNTSGTSGNLAAGCALYDYGTNRPTPANHDMIGRGRNLITFSTASSHAAEDIATNTAVWGIWRADPRQEGHSVLQPPR
jgi:O-antigen ligase